jgi:ribosomal protein S18 acetylase RimI-like enzyme
VIDYPSLPPELFKPPASLPPGVRFRLAQPDDLPELQLRCFPDQEARRLAAQFRRMLQRQRHGRGYHLLAVMADPATIRSRLVGSGQLLLHPHSAELAELAVTAAYRGLGIGTALITILTRIARHLALPALEIGVAVTNSRALTLYHRLGFVEDRRLEMPFAQAAEPAIILVKELPPGGAQHDG